MWSLRQPTPIFETEHSAKRKPINKIKHRAKGFRRRRVTLNSDDIVVAAMSRTRALNAFFALSRKLLYAQSTRELNLSVKDNESFRLMSAINFVAHYLGYWSKRKKSCRTLLMTRR